MLNHNEMEIKTTYGGFSCYMRGIFPDGSTTGRIEYTDQSTEEIRLELLSTLKTGRDDVNSFINTIINTIIGVN